MGDSNSRPKRLIFRRWAAKFIDFFLVGVFLQILVFLISSVSPVQVLAGAGLNFGTSVCGPLQSTDMLEIVGALSPAADERVSVGLCRWDGIGTVSRFTGIVRVTREAENSRQSRFITFAASEDGNVVPSINADAPAVLAVPFLMALLQFWGRPSPGKALMRLRLKATRAHKRRLLQYTAREYLIFAPLVLFAIASLFISPVYLDKAALLQAAGVLISGSFLWVMVAASFVGFLHIAILGWTVLIWNGAIFYDRLAGFEVWRKKDLTEARAT